MGDHHFNPLALQKVENEDGDDDEESPPPPATGDSRTVTLRSGATLTLSTSASLMALKGEDRKFILAVIDMFDQFEATVPEDGK